ncbi:phosphotransferase [Rothia sp. ND6WE1A]|uniref:phosphotransferase n=1 Tax=Rothia sp. ND6WE1A TaxID=1848190 RepID=UPI00082C9C9E|nr:phosphotransferase [Rothia sp. ND6WE1A]SIL16264.1 Uncharacterised protein [Mycobacteroides abscessus subsp. abscessus]
MVHESLTDGFSSLCEKSCALYELQPGDSPVTTPKFRALLQMMVTLGATRLEAGALENIEILSAGMRSVVVRGDFERQSAILKYFRRKDSAVNSGGFGYLREKHGLICLNDTVPGSFSRLLFAEDSQRVLGIEYVPGRSLADYFLDSAQAQAALSSWIDFWTPFAQQNSSQTKGAIFDFAHRLAQADPAASTPGMIASPQMALKGLIKLVEQRKIPGRVGESLTPIELDQLQQQLKSIVFPPRSELTILSSGDFSPHNILITDLENPSGSNMGSRGIDAEGSAIHHRYLPLAEMLLGFPSADDSGRYSRFVSSTWWLDSARTLYERAFGYPGSQMLTDPLLGATILTVQCVLAEQGQNISVPQTVTALTTPFDL